MKSRVGAAAAIQGILSSVTSRGSLAEKSVTRKIGHVRGHVIMAGFKHQRHYAVESLDEIKIGHVIITVDPAVTHSLRSPIPCGHPFPAAVRGLATYASEVRPFQAMRKAGVLRASTLVCALDDDGESLLVATSARKKNNDVTMMRSHVRVLASRGGLDLGEREAGFITPAERESRGRESLA